MAQLQRQKEAQSQQAEAQAQQLLTLQALASKQQATADLSFKQAQESEQRLTDIVAELQVTAAATY